jgi:membrane protease YdiL (CAAX protease family)
MATIKAFVTRYSVPTYFGLAFAISWGGILLVLGPGGFTGTTQPTDVLLPLVYVAMCAGPSVAGILLTGLADGKAGVRELVSRLLRWRVGGDWYAVALLTAPLVMMTVLLTLSLTSPRFLPGILVSNDKATLLLSGLAGGLMAAFFEELGWTGFAVPRLRRRHGVLTTGLIVGLLWGAWHFPLFSGGDLSGALSPVVFLPVQLFSMLPPFRVLMAWVYDRTGSLLVAMIMHVSLTTSTLTLQPLEVAGIRALSYDLVLAAALWVVVVAVAMAKGARLSRQPVPCEHTGTT